MMALKSGTATTTAEDVGGWHVLEAVSVVSNFENSRTSEHFDTDANDCDMDSHISENTSKSDHISLCDNPLIGRNRRRKIQFCACLGILAGLAIFLFAFLFIGAAIEAREIRSAPPTTSLYTENDKFCVLRDDGSGDICTIENEVNAKASGNVTHCGGCGKCSTMEDMEILARTRKTLTDTTTACAYRMFLGKRKVSSCMEKKVGFTPPCKDCWVDNIQCTFHACKFTCLKSKILGEGKNKKHGNLNDCLECDEVMCGAAFLNCSGANRRRMGIASDIGRDQLTEQCKGADINWESLFPADMK